MERKLVAAVAADNHRVVECSIQAGHLVFILGQRQRCTVAVDCRAESTAGPGNHVEVQRAEHVNALAAQHSGVVIAAQNPLLFAGEGDELERDFRVLLRHDAGRLDCHRGAGGVIVGARCVVVRVLGRAVHVAADDNDLGGVRVSDQRADNIAPRIAVSG